MNLRIATYGFATAILLLSNQLAFSQRIIDVKRINHSPVHMAYQNHSYQNGTRLTAKATNDSPAVSEDPRNSLIMNQTYVDPFHGNTQPRTATVAGATANITKAVWSSKGNLPIGFIGPAIKQDSNAQNDMSATITPAGQMESATASLHYQTGTQMVYIPVNPPLARKRLYVLCVEFKFSGGSNKTDGIIAGRTLMRGSVETIPGTKKSRIWVTYEADGKFYIHGTLQKQTELAPNAPAFNFPAGGQELPVVGGKLQFPNLSASQLIRQTDKIAISTSCDPKMTVAVNAIDPSGVLTKNSDLVTNAVIEAVLKDQVKGNNQY